MIYLVPFTWLCIIVRNTGVFILIIKRDWNCTACIFGVSESRLPCSSCEPELVPEVRANAGNKGRRLFMFSTFGAFTYKPWGSFPNCLNGLKRLKHSFWNVWVTYDLYTALKIYELLDLRACKIFRTPAEHNCRVMCKTCGYQFIRIWVWAKNKISIILNSDGSEMWPNSSGISLTKKSPIE